MNAPIAHGSRYLITSGLLNESNFQTSSAKLIRTVRRAADSGIELIQLREKALPARLLYALAVKCLGAIGSAGTRLFVNDRFDIALAAGAHGVHLRSTSVPVSVVRRCVPADLMIALSIHTPDEATQARSAGADFAMFGPVFASPGKGAGQGLAALAAACDAAGDMPVVAVGGIVEARVESILKTGAKGYAAIRYLNDFVNIGK